MISCYNNIMDLIIKPELLTDERHLTTAEIYYHLPDFPCLLQTYIWQDVDTTPDFPMLYQFLNFWERKLEGKLHSVEIVKADILTPTHFSYADEEYTLQ